MISCFNPSDLENILKTSRKFEKAECHRTKRIVTIQSQCGVGYSLLTCIGGPGDQFEDGEGWFIDPNFTNNLCTLQIRGAACTSHLPLTWQRSIAVCYQNGK